MGDDAVSTGSPAPHFHIFSVPLEAGGTSSLDGVPLLPPSTRSARRPRVYLTAVAALLAACGVGFFADGLLAADALERESVKCREPGSRCMDSRLAAYAAYAFALSIAVQLVLLAVFLSQALDDLKWLARLPHKGAFTYSILYHRNRSKWFPSPRSFFELAVNPTTAALACTAAAAFVAFEAVVRQPDPTRVIVAPTSSINLFFAAGFSSAVLLTALVCNAGASFMRTTGLVETVTAMFKPENSMRAQNPTDWEGMLALKGLNPWTVYPDDELKPEDFGTHLPVHAWHGEEEEVEDEDEDEDEDQDEEGHAWGGAGASPSPDGSYTGGWYGGGEVGEENEVEEDEDEEESRRDEETQTPVRIRTAAAKPKKAAPKKAVPKKPAGKKPAPSSSSAAKGRTRASSATKPRGRAASRTPSKRGGRTPASGRASSARKKTR